MLWAPLGPVVSLINAVRVPYQAVFSDSAEDDSLCSNTQLLCTTAVDLSLCRHPRSIERTAACTAAA